MVQSELLADRMRLWNTQHNLSRSTKCTPLSEILPICATAGNDNFENNHFIVPHNNITVVIATAGSNTVLVNI